MIVRLWWSLIGTPGAQDRHVGSGRAVPGVAMCVAVDVVGALDATDHQGVVPALSSGRCRGVFHRGAASVLVA